VVAGRAALFFAKEFCTRATGRRKTSADALRIGGRSSTRYVQCVVFFFVDRL